MVEDRAAVRGSHALCQKFARHVIFVAFGIRLNCSYRREIVSRRTDARLDGVISTSFQFLFFFGWSFSGFSGLIVGFFPLYCEGTIFEFFTVRTR